MRKHTLGTVFSASLLLFSLVSCGSKELDKVSSFSMDWQTGDFAFEGIDNADEYRVRIFEVITDENGQNVDDELPANESSPLRGGKENYTGNVPLWSLNPAGLYHAYVYATSSEYGSSTSDANEGHYIYQFDMANSDTVNPYMEENSDAITVALQSDLYDGNLQNGANFEIKLYENGAQINETKTILGSDIKKEVKEDGSEGDYIGNTVEFKSYQYADKDKYSVTVKIISTSDYLIGTEESDPIAVTEKQTSGGGGSC